jgi:hypothetical protein
MPHPAHNHKSRRCRRRELVTHETDLSDVIDFRAAAAAQCSAQAPAAESGLVAEAAEAVRVRCVASSSGRTVRPYTPVPASAAIKHRC